MPLATTDPESATKSWAPASARFRPSSGTGRELRRAPYWRQSPWAALERFPAKWALVRVKKTRQREKLKACVPTLAQALWRFDVSGPSSFEGTRDREPPSAYACGGMLGPAATSRARKTLSQKSLNFCVRIFGCGVGSPSKPSAMARNIPLAGLDPFAVRADTGRAAPRCSDDGLEWRG
jgi:hypothetical protein